MLTRVGTWSFTNRGKVIGLWVVLLAVIFAWGGAIGSSFNDGRALPESGSARGFDVLAREFGGLGAGLTGSIVFRAGDRFDGIDDPAVRSTMQELFAEVGDVPGVQVSSPYAEGPQAAGQINADRTVAFANVSLATDIDQTEAGKVGEQIIGLVPEVDGLQIEVGGQSLAVFKPPSSELVGLAFAIVVLILAFGSVLAMGLPIAVALGGVGAGMGLVILISNVTNVPEFSTTIGAMIGLGVGIDYALFIVTRYREGLHAGMTPAQANRRAMDTAGRAVIFAGLTVVVSLLGMLLIGLSFITGLGISSAVTVTATMLSSVTLLPALLGFAGARIEVTRWRGLIAAGLFAIALLGLGLKISPLLLGAPLAIIVLALGFAVAPLRRQVPVRARKPLEQTLAYRWSHLVQARPWTSIGIGVVIMGILAIPLFGLRLGFSDEGNFPKNSTTRQAYDLLSDGFGPGFNGPLLVTVTADEPGQIQSVLALGDALTATPGVAAVSEPIPNGVEGPLTPEAAQSAASAADAFLFRVIPTTSPQDEATSTLVDRLRTDVIPMAVAGAGLDVNVTGNVAVGIDFTQYLSERMVLFFAVVLTLSFLLLMAVFRSLLVPLKAVIMNIISIAAAYGVIVAIFQWGWGGSLLGIEPAPLEPFLPLMMFAIVFGLSMDYEVFLLSRIKEEFDRHGDARNSVADGLAATARVITAAAAIMVVVFGSFVAEENRIAQAFGLGLAVAVLLDATIVRMLMVPATMELLGEKNWWIPRWLDRILPQIDVEGHSVMDDDELVEPTVADIDSVDSEPVNA